MKRVKLPFAPSIEVEFTDREKALKQVECWAESGTRFPIVVFGPEGCGKSAWLRQSIEILRGLDYEVVYVDPLHREFLAYTSVREVVEKLLKASSETLGIAEIKLATLAIDVIKDILRIGKRRVAVLVDEVFQAIGIDRAAMYVKSLLNLIEYPPRSYEKIVAVVATSESLSRREIGRHLWSEIRSMWNMSKEGFREFYDKIPGPKPNFEYAWIWTGGNPRLLSQLHQAKWNVNEVVKRIIVSREITANFIEKWRGWIEKIVEDPDNIWSTNAPENFINELTAKNLIVYYMYDRDEKFWVDLPPRDRDPEIGIGRYVAWQTPLHREAVRKALTK